MFEQFGRIEELQLIKEPDGTSKGCAFLKYELKESSILAIRGLNASAYILNHDKPLEVRFAENRKKTGPTSGGYGHSQPGPYNAGGPGGPGGQSGGSYGGGNNMYQPWGGGNNYYQVLLRVRRS